MPITQHITFYKNDVIKTCTERMDGELVCYEEYAINGELTYLKKIVSTTYWTTEKISERKVTYTSTRTKLWIIDVWYDDKGRLLEYQRRRRFDSEIVYDILTSDPDNEQLQYAQMRKRYDECGVIQKIIKINANGVKRIHSFDHKGYLMMDQSTISDVNQATYNYIPRLSN